MDDTMNNITFYDHWLPMLAPGEYFIKVTPTIRMDVANRTVAVQNDPKDDAITEAFYVGAPRWALTGSEVYSCYPSPGQVGQFDGTLPHVVFDRCTLPWERTTDGTDATKNTPWLALILLTDSDFKSRPVPSVVSRTLSALMNPEAKDNAITPALQSLDKYDLPDQDLCQTIDLPASLFSAVMPTMQDLPYLAHVREVNTDNKETWSLLKDGRFSVVVCNRFPETQATGNGKDWGIVNSVFLLSLEGWGHYLLNPEKLDHSDKNCRFVVLGSWRFTCQGTNNFKALMNNLDDKSLLSLPQNDNLGNNLRQALAKGFVPINHDLRNSDTTISWYRGPLTPMEYKPPTNYPDISCADAALQYSPNTGMFDASYAAAWQLGRLLALQDRAFAEALFAFRTSYQRWVRRLNASELSKIEKRSNLNAGQAALLTGGPQDIRAWYLQQVTNPSTNPSSDTPPDGPEIPATVQNWLGQALLLYGVPFQYLVPDTEMLPTESIRFFYLNPDWINCLLQGACSVGRTSETDELADQLLRSHFFDVSKAIAAKLRLSAKASADARRDGNEAKTNDVKLNLNWPITGYLLRSEAVESWIGLEAKATDANEKELDILRMDRLAPDTLLAIYNGEINSLEITQPPEAIHFGASSLNGNYKKTLRTEQGPGKSINIPLRGARVMNLAVPNFLGTGTTSAQFAYQMIDSPAKVTFSRMKKNA